jgi:retron-type reverse transcriptase
MAKQYGFDYTRYADDLTFSASGESLRNISNIFQNTRLIVEQEDFEINEQKTRVIRRYQQQEVTGIVVNDKLNVSRRKAQNFRAVLIKWKKTVWKVTTGDSLRISSHQLKVLLICLNGQS